MFTSTRPSSRRYQVAVETGCPSGRSVVITAGCGLLGMANLASGSGGFDMASPLPRVVLRAVATDRTG
jgi:hypothetical protein